jgi:SagB-type dehydrogenase family enzyme
MRSSLRAAVVCAVFIGAALAVAALAQPRPATPAGEAAGASVAMPAPQKTGGRGLMDCLNDRRTERRFAPDALSPQQVSNLLWAAFGVNRPASGKRTAPSAVNWQEIDLYVARQDGLFLFDAKAHGLKPVLAEDIRPLAGTQAFVKTAPLVLIYVADFARMARASDKDKEFYAACDTGFISQNVYLFCASEGLGTCVVGLVNREELARKIGLRPEQRITLSQPVGALAK